MEGFISTSIVVEQASGFFEDTWIEIRVNPDNLGGEVDWGFADIKDISCQPGEKEILFNPINIFRVVECKTDYDVKLPAKAYVTAKQFIVLEYAALTDVMKKKRRK